MSERTDNLGKQPPKRSASPAGQESGLHQDEANSTRRYWQCTVCSQLAEYTDDRTSCEACGGSLVAIYSGASAELVSGHDQFEVPPPPPAVEFVERRRFSRMRCKNVRACVKTAEGASAVVDVVNMSRGGLCFTSLQEFSVGAAVSIATHFIEGGFNIFQPARIVRFRPLESSTETARIEYGVEFLTEQHPSQ